MIKLTAISVIAISMAACSTTKTETTNPTSNENKASYNPLVTSQNTTNSLQQQRMTSSFKRNGLKLEWNCNYKNKDCVNPEVTAIEATAYATTNGLTENNRDTAFKIATLRAKAKLRRFIQEDITTTTVVNVFTKNIEKANQKITNNITDDSEISATEEEVISKNDRNISETNNSNQTVRKITEHIKSSASGILKGIHVVDESVINANNVAVTIRWDKNLENITQYLNIKFSN